MSDPVPVTTYPPCVDCGELDAGTCPEGRCRDCDLEHVVAGSTCRACLRWQLRAVVFDAPYERHAPGCALAHDPAPLPRDRAEYLAVRQGRYGWSPSE